MLCFLILACWTRTRNIGEQVIPNSHFVYGKYHSYDWSLIYLKMICFAALVSKREKMYSGSFDVIRKTIKERGVLGMYRGVQVLLTGTIPTYAIR